MGAVSAYTPAMPASSAVAILSPNPPSDPLVDMERDLAGLAVEYGILKRAYPHEARANDRANVAREMSCIQKRAAELRKAIVEAEAETPAGADEHWMTGAPYPCQTPFKPVSVAA